MTYYVIKTVNNLYLNYDFYSTFNPNSEYDYGDEGYCEIFHCEIFEVDFKDCLILNKEELDKFITEYNSGFFGRVAIDEHSHIKIKTIEEIWRVPTHDYNRILGGE